MIDVLLRFDSRDQAGEVGQALGFTIPGESPGEWNTTTATLEMAICVIGEHFYPSGATTPGPGGEPIPVMVGDGKLWVMVRSLIDMEFPPQILPFLVTRNPADPLQPQHQWA